MIFIEDMEFDGKTYDPKQDKRRLSGNLLAVFDTLKNGDKMTLFELSEKSGVPLNSVSSRFRDLRKRKFGGYDMRSERKKGGTWLYWMVDKCKCDNSSFTRTLDSESNPICGRCGKEID